MSEDWSMQIVLIAAVSIFLFLIIAAGVAGAGWIYYDQRKRQRGLIESMDHLAASVESCGKSQIAAVEHLADSVGDIGKVPELLAGIKSVCETYVAQVVELSGLINKFHGSLFGPVVEKARPTDAWKPYSDTEADDAWEIEQMVQNGFSREEALEKVTATRKSNSRFTLG